MQTTARSLAVCCHWAFKQDNNPKHTSKVVQASALSERPRLQTTQLEQFSME